LRSTSWVSAGSDRAREYNYHQRNFQRWNLFCGEEEVISYPEALIGRAHQWEALAKAWEQSGPALILVSGVRSSGKSFLLSRFAQARAGVYFQATRRTESEQRACLCRALGRYFDDPDLVHAPLPSWRGVFEYLTAQAGRAPFLLILDEFPFLSAVEPDLLGVLREFWEERWQRTRICLVLAGSHVPMMSCLEAPGNPLESCGTERLFFSPLPFDQAALFAPEWEPRDRLLLYALFGGLPGHLGLISPDRTPGENFARHVLHPHGRLADEGERFLDAFVPDAEVHYSIIESIATGGDSWSDLSSRTGRSGGALSRPLKWLEEMGVLAREVAITESPRSRRARYSLADPYLRTWHAAVAPLLRDGSLGLVDPEALWERAILPHLDELAEAAFARSCRDWLTRTTALSFRPARVGRWWDAHGHHEICAVALSDGGDVFVAACRWREVLSADFAALTDSAARMIAELPDVSSVSFGLFSGRGEFDEDLLRAADRNEVQLFGPGDLF
jgi:uncharacterized protein